MLNIKALVSGLLIFTLFSSFAQKKKNSLFWEISHKDLNYKSYLFGTIHIQDSRVFSFSSEVWEALKTTKTFAPELNIKEIDMNEVQKSLLADTSLDKILDSTTYAYLDSSFKIVSGGISIQLMNSIKPFFILTQLQTSFIKQDMPMALDMFLTDTAIALGNTIKAIETYGEQMDAINSISLKEQANMLVRFFDSTDQIANQTKELIQLYLNQEIYKMDELMNDSSYPNQFEEQFLLKRNKKMAERISNFIINNPTFAAVGAAHLAGENGLISILEKKGYQLKPIKISFNN